MKWLKKYNIFEKNINCPVIKLSQEVISYVNNYSSCAELLKSGGIPYDVLKRLAFGFTDEDIKTLMPSQLKIKWESDFLNVIHEVEHSKLTNIQWARKIDISSPIDVSYEKNDFYIEDGHHRYYAAKILNKPLNVDLEIKMSAVLKLAPELHFDDFHRCIFKQIKNEN